MSSLSPPLRRRSECLGLACGVAGGTLAVTAPSNSMVLWIVSASALAGAIGNLLTNAGEDPGLRPRAGIRAGVVAAIVAGAAAVLCVTINSPYAGFRAVLPALLAIPPGAFFGLLGSLMVSMIQNPQVRPVGQWEPKTRTKPSVLLIGTLVCSALGYASPFIAARLPRRAEPVLPATFAAPKPAPTTPKAPEPPSRPPVPPPPPWRYETPANFAGARPGQLRVMKEISLGRFDSPLRVTLSKDGRWFAFARPGSNIIALDINEPETTTTFPVPETPRRFAFSPDAKRLFCITNSGAKYVLSPERTIRLPLPKDTPDGGVEWTDEGHIRIGNELLDLDTLQLARTDTPTTEPVRHANIALRQRLRFNAMRDGEPKLNAQRFLTDTKRDYCTILPVIAEDAFLSPDATKLFAMQGGELAVSYFEMNPSRETRLSVQMPGAPPVEFADLIKSRRLITLLCPPIINPLNHKPVGADTTRVKAVLGIESWEGTTAKCWVKEDHGTPIEDNDTAALLFNTEHGRLVEVKAFENWWSLVRDVSPGDAPAIIAEPPKPNVPAREAPPVARPAPPVIPENTAERLRSFVRFHHAKSSRGDVDGLVADYAERVDHLKGEVVSREVIREDELKYHSPGTRVSETVVGDITLTSVSDTLARATYTIRFEQTRPSGAWARGFSDIELVIDHTGPSLRIVRQRAKSRDTQKGP